MTVSAEYKSWGDTTSKTATAKKNTTTLQFLFQDMRKYNLLIFIQQILEQ